MSKVIDLVEFLKKCDDAYYNSDTVLVSNDTYDSLVQSLKVMDPENPYLKKVGAEVRKGSSKVGRINPMGTLSKYHTEDEVKEWLSHESGKVLLAPKYDGFGVELTYLDGKLVMASTRGDGHTGEDVTEAMKLVNYVPTELPEVYKSLVTVRGEAIIPRKYHDKVKSLGYAAMRNAVPGIVRSCNKEALPYVDFIAYEFFDDNNMRLIQRIFYSNLFNIEEYDSFHTSDFEDILEVRKNFGDIKDRYMYEVDGMVLKTNVIKEDDLSCPSHQIAWKFKSNRRETILRSIEFQLGATGKFTPIGVFDPVEFQGAQLSRASLGSMDRYYDMKPCVGDTIEVSRRGDIIPYIEEVVESSGEFFFDLRVCPHCGKPLHNNMCVNKECPEIVFLQIRNFVGSLGVKGIGPSLVKGLITSGAIKKLSDIYYVTSDQILSLPRQGQSAADKWSDLKNKELEVKVFLSAMPFDNIGIKAWESLLEKWKFYDLMEVTEDDLRSAGIRGFGEGKITEFVRQLNIYKDEIVEMYQVANVK